MHLINISNLQRQQPEETRSSCFDAHPGLATLCASSSYLSQALFLLLLLLLMLVNRHLQKVLFTADEAHRASHPSKPRAHTSKPIQSKTSTASFSPPPPLGVYLLIVTLLRSNRRLICALNLASLRCQSSIAKEFPALVFSLHTTIHALTDGHTEVR